MTPLYIPEQKARIEIDRQLEAAAWAVLQRAFAGELVPQDPDDDLAGEAMTSADLGVRAEMKNAIYSGARAIEHGGLLPELPEFSIILYCDRRSGNHLVESLGTP